MTLAAGRFGIAGAILYLVLRMRHEWPRVVRQDRTAFFALGTCGIALTYAVFYGGMRYTTATETTLLVAAEPVLIAFMARVVLGERLQPLQLGGMLTGLLGVYLIVMRGVIPRFEGTAVANAVVAAALIFESLSSVIGKRLSGRYPPLMVASLGMLVGSAVLSPLAVWEVVRYRTIPGPWELVSVAYLTLVCSALCYGIWYALLGQHTLSSMAAFLFIQPIMGPVLGYVILREMLGAASVVGAILVVLGVWLVVSRPHVRLSRIRRQV